MEPGTKQELLPVPTTPPPPLLSTLPTQQAAGPSLRHSLQPLSVYAEPRHPPTPAPGPGTHSAGKAGRGWGWEVGRALDRCFSKVLSNYQFGGQFSFKSQISLPLPNPFQRTTPPSPLASMGFFHRLSGLPLPLCTGEEMLNRSVQGLAGLRGLGLQRTDPACRPTTCGFFL